jgi:hypothetical protein
MFTLCCSHGATRRQRYPAQSNLNAHGGVATTLTDYLVVVLFLNNGWLARTRNAPRLLSARSVNLIVIGDQVSALPFSPLPLHSALNFAY